MRGGFSSFIINYASSEVFLFFLKNNSVSFATKAKGTKPNNRRGNEVFVSCIVSDFSVKMQKVQSQVEKLFKFARNTKIIQRFKQLWDFKFCRVINAMH